GGEVGGLEISQGNRLHHRPVLTVVASIPPQALRGVAILACRNRKFGTGWARERIGKIRRARRGENRERGHAGQREPSACLENSTPAEPAEAGRGGGGGVDHRHGVKNRRWGRH